MAGSEPFAGVAQSLLREDIPAVIAIQFDISDHASITFSKEFYSAISMEQHVEAALAQARKVLHIKLKSLVEWGTPVLYMQVSDGLLFKFIKPDETAKVTDKLSRTI